MTVGAEPDEGLRPFAVRSGDLGSAAACPLPSTAVLLVHNLRRGSGVRPTSPATVCRMPHTGPLVRALAVAATGIMAAATLGACSDGEQSSGAAVSSGAEPPASSSPEPSMSGGYVVGPDGKLLKPTDAPVPVLPETPASITENTPEAAEDFARYFVAVTEYAWNSGDTTRLKEISTEDCVLCEQTIAAIADEHTSSSWTVGLRYEITSAEDAILISEQEDMYAVVLHVRSSSMASYDGKSVQPYGPFDELIELHTCRTGDVWLACGGVGADDPDV